MSLLSRRWIILDWLLPGVLRAQDIPYSETKSTKQAIDDVSAGITEPTHEVLDTLVHNLSEDNFTEYTRASGRVTNIDVWTDSSKTTRIRSTALTYISGRVSQETDKQYDAAGSVKITKTTAFVRSGGVVINENVTVVYA